MVVVMGNGAGGTDEGAGETGDAVFGMAYHAEPFLFIKIKDLGGTDIHTHLAAPAGLVVDINCD